MSSSLKYHLNSRFRTCHRIAKAFDLCRNRDVTLYLIPGRFDLVGVDDTVDVWMAPVAADPFSVNIKRIVADIQAGKPLHEIEVVSKRKSVDRTQLSVLLGSQPSADEPPSRKRRATTPEPQEPPAVPERKRRTH